MLAQQREHRAVAGPGQPAGLAVVGGAAVEAGDHVAAHPARLQVGGVGVEVGQPAVVEDRWASSQAGSSTVNRTAAASSAMGMIAARR